MEKRIDGSLSSAHPKLIVLIAPCVNENTLLDK